MIPAAFEYQRAQTVDEAVSLLSQNGEDAKLLAGGHSLLPLMKLRLAAPSLLIDIGRLSDLSYVREDGDRRGHRRPDPPPRPRDQRRPARTTALCWPTSPARSAIRRCATAAPSAALSPMATRPRICRPPAWPWVPPSPLVGTERRAPRRRHRLLPRLPGDGPGARRGPDRDPGAEGGRGGLVVPEVQPAGPGLGHRRAWSAVNGPAPGVGARQHGTGAAAGRRGRGGAGRRGLGPPRRPPMPPTASTRPRISTPAPSTAATWPRCWCAGRWRRPGSPRGGRQAGQGRDGGRDDCLNPCRLGRPVAASATTAAFPRQIACLAADA